MASLGKFKKACGKPVDRLAEVAGEPEGSDLFVRILAEYGVCVIETNVDGEDGFIEFLEHVDGDQTYLAVFSSREPAAEFLEKQPANQVTSFICYEGSPDILLEYDYDPVILNPMTSVERKISQREIAALRVLCRNQQDSELE